MLHCTTSDRKSMQNDPDPPVMYQTMQDNVQLATWVSTQVRFLRPSFC
jgi:hypothetical protein